MGTQYHLSDDATNSAEFITGFAHIAPTSVVWFRRITPPNITNSIDNSEEKFFAEETWNYTLIGSLTRCPVWVNHFWKHRAANNKILQLRLAKQHGLCIPKTLVTSSPQCARDFISTGGQFICKVAHNHFRGISAATILLSPEKVEQLDTLTACPAIFQERIAVKKNIRVVYCGMRVFSFESDDCGIDWRLQPNIPWRVHHLPSAINAKLKSLLDNLGLVYGVIDMIFDDSNRYIFLEVNPGGQFMFLELWAQVGIPSAIAEMLIDAGGLSPKMELGANSSE